MIKKVLAATIIILVIGGLIYAQKTQKGGNENGGPSNGVISGYTRQGIDDRRSKADYQSTEVSVDGGKEKSGENSNPQPKTNQSKQSVSRASDRTSSASIVSVSRVAGIFKVTAYTAGYESTGKRPGHPAYGITASGAKVKENHTVAADWNLLPVGTKLMIEGLEHIYTVEDRGSAVKGKHIDLYIEDLEDALRWGVQERKVTIIKLGGK